MTSRLLWFLAVFLVLMQVEKDGPVMQLAIPSISLDEPVYPAAYLPEVPSWQVLDNYVGWHNLSAIPGQPGNTILNGHSNAYGRVFKNLFHLKRGDHIFLVYQGKVYSYVVRWHFLVREEGVTREQRLLNGRWIQSTSDVRLTLVTCADGKKYRLIVVAFP